MATVAAAAVAVGRQRIVHMKETAIKHIETNIDLASSYIQTGDIDNPRVYCKTCMKLGSAIDSAIAVNAFPLSSHLPQLIFIVREVHRRKTELLQPSLMLLMLPIKAACQTGWFADADKYGLLMIAKEVSYGFSDTDKMSIEPSNAHLSVSNIVSRFYPTMKVEHILTSFVVKAGYGTFVADFHISLGTTPRHCRDLWLLVAQLDNMDTAACISGPLNVDFLINGSGVPNRTKNDMGKGPQLPSNITKMIKYGLNLLQVFGDFDGQYIIALAFMNPISPDPSQLHDYLRPMSGGVDSDCDVMQMPSRVSLYCPVSQHRIKTPVKGHLCKHPQCFDYNYFIEANSIEPTWKCPVCNNPVCYPDIRIDQDFLKILNEVPDDVNDVMISDDGSWMVAEANRDTMSHTSVTTPAVSLDKTQVNGCTTKQAQSTTIFMPTAGSLGQTQVNVSTTNQAQSTTMLTPSATVTIPASSPVQTKVNDCTTRQAKSTIVFTPPAGAPSQAQVNVCTTNEAQTTTMFTPPATVTIPGTTLGQTKVNDCTTMQAQSTIVFTPPAGSPGHAQANICATNQAQTATMFTPPATVAKPTVAPSQTQVKLCTTMGAKSSTVFTPLEGSPGQSLVNACTTNQTRTTTMFIPPAPVTKRTVSPSQTPVNATQAKNTTMFTPPTKSQLAPSTLVSPTQQPEASGDAMPSGRMRGSLTGDRLEAARLQYLAPPQQPALANKPWLRPPIPSLPSALLMPQTPTNPDNA
ncbi:hypothetical protein QVD17_21625 [Tagetes erecta]|uniref:SP-RING-type domain-containing protein n=1 Tax=Tagetes erecta TaxID=13708 RepID=A0AAD8KC59_TARER|nr:hypothetical protein QVD17_21625 [Tagetes erecta]